MFLVVKVHQETIVELIEACHWPLLYGILTMTTCVYAWLCINGIP